MSPQANTRWVRLPLLRRKRWTKGRSAKASSVGSITRERAQSFLADDHIERIVQAYEKFKDEPGLARVVTMEEIRAKDGNLSIPLYIAPDTNTGANSANGNQARTIDLTSAMGAWLESARNVRQELRFLLEEMK